MTQNEVARSLFALVILALGTSCGAFSAAPAPARLRPSAVGSCSSSAAMSAAHSPEARPASVDVTEAADIIRSAQRIVIFTGAGMSADSGIATFRKDPNSMWSGLKGTLGLAFFGTPLGWRLMPGLAWRVYLSEFYAPIAAASPHAGFAALARLESERFRAACTVVTMNVDQLHEAAGSERVVHVHGSVSRIRCTSCHTSVTGHPCDLPAGQGVASLRELRCSDCGSYVRPDVVLFGESLPADEWRAAVEACRNLSSRDCMLVVGTSGGVYPAAGLPEAVLAAGVPLIEVNKDPSPISRAAQCFLQGTAAEVLPRLVAAVLAS